MIDLRRELPMAEYKRDTYIKPISNIENIAYYKTARDGKLYFCCGKTRIEVVEHFADHGKTLGVLVEDVITHAACTDAPNIRLN